MSAKRCCVSKCTNTCADTILHVFPKPNKDLDRFNAWKGAIGGHILNLDDETIFNIRRVCHSHFETYYHTRSKRLSPNALPTLNLSVSLNLARPPLQDVTNRMSDKVRNEDISLPYFDQDNQSNNAQVFLPTQRAVLPLHSTSLTQVRNKKEIKYIKSFSHKVVALGNKIKDLQESKSTTGAKMKKVAKLFENSTFKNTLKKFTAPASVFTHMQFREAKKKKMGRRFTKEEKLLALAMFKQGPRAYRWKRLFFVLPSPVTMSRMIRNASLQPGINENLFQQLKRVASKMNLKEKLCVLLFDEIALTPHLDYNNRTDKIGGFIDGICRKKKIADHAMVFMLRGIYKNYKQPIAYSFCFKTTAREDLIVQIKKYITKLQDIGFIVVATICDQGATNVSALNYLINETRREYIKLNKELKHSIFEINGEEIIPLYDTPHLIKGIRNNLLTKDLKCVINEKELIGKWDHILKLYEENPAYQGIRLLPKLTERHVIPNKISKMKVKCATQVFSETVAGNMGFLARHGILPKESEQTADILIFFDKLFDSLNGSYNKSKQKTAKLLLGPVTPSSPHKKFWIDAKKVLKSMSYIKDGKCSIVPSIRHWIQTLENIEYLRGKLSQKYSLNSLWMRHFNQDPLENYFGSIRSHGYRNISPTCAAFEAAFASLLVNNLSNHHSPGSNCEIDSCKLFNSLKIIFFKKYEMNSNCAEELDFEDLNINFNNLAVKNTNIKIKSQLEYVSGYVLRKLKSKVFKNCEFCNQCLFNKEKCQSLLIHKEYFKNKTCLTYPSMRLVECFSNIQDVIINILRNKSLRENIKTYIRMILSVVINYNFITCHNHKKDIVNELENLTVNFFIYNWCKDCNKLLNGSRTDFDINDEIQKMCVDYLKRK